jgi:hypothetical protein
LHVTKELRNIRVKLNEEDHIWILFITTINQYYVHTHVTCHHSPTCEEGRRTHWYIYIYVEVIHTNIYTYIYTHTHSHTHTHTHTYTAKYSFNILESYL